ncbi:aconitase iron-sulfur domain-containing protein [Jackrogersella minutella]|nr:aconitase iron-sulfur domain-containing protein [Jackrogersella minutella]
MATKDTTYSQATVKEQLEAQLSQIRGVHIEQETQDSAKTPLQVVEDLVERLRKAGYSRESEALRHVSKLCQQSPNYGGLGLVFHNQMTPDEVSELLFLSSAWLESLNSADRVKRNEPNFAATKPSGVPPMNITEKIFAMHDIEQKGFVQAGQTVQIFVDWVMASEISWSGMEATYEQIGKPGIFRNDRFWLAGDHVVDPRVRTNPTVKKLVESSEKARKVFKMTEYQGMNYTIMHTEFFRERSQPGMMIIGSDSHTCSSGANGCLAIGLGASDVTMALTTGEIWFQVPEVVNVRFVGAPARCIGGKDIILYVLQQLKRNTVASDRIVEFTGPGLEHLSPDARFAISNMTTEFGGITGIFAPDHVTKTFIDSRRLNRHKSSSHYFRPDYDAHYAETHAIDLSKVRPFVARYPSPDDVVSVGDMEGTSLDGCFIGACTTTEEDLILGALVLEQGLKAGLTPINHGKRKVVPGSLPISDMLRRLGLAEIYEQAGFEIGVPGCSYCVGMSADRAGEGEVWLTSQNRNYQNRMGKGSFGHLGSATTVAASSFTMRITDPQPLINSIDLARWHELKGRGSLHRVRGMDPQFIEPAPPQAQVSALIRDLPVMREEKGDQTPKGSGQSTTEKNEVIRGKIQRLGDSVDTDALAPAQFLIGSKVNEEIGDHCLEFTNPEFRSRAKDGFNIVVAGKGFGCGSSREQAVSALLGCGIKCVITKSFAFIFSRNLPNLGLMGFTVSDDAFFDVAQDSEDIEIDLVEQSVSVAGQKFRFQLSAIESELMKAGGITPAFTKFGKHLFHALCENSRVVAKKAVSKVPEDIDSPANPLQW